MAVGRGKGREKGSWTRSGQLFGIVWRCLCNNTLSDLIWHITADISRLAAYHPASPSTLYSPFLLHLTAKPLIETNFQYNRTTNNMTDATKSYVVDSFFPSNFLPFAIRFVYLAPKSVTFYERSFVLPHCASAATQFGHVPLFLRCFYLRFSPSPSSTSCCFRNFMLLTNLSLSGLLFTQGSPQAPRHPFSIAFNVLVADD